MTLNIQKTINELKQRVKLNVSQINNNQASIKKLLNQDRNNERQYEAYNTRNKELLAQNNDLINVQLTLVNFLDKYSNTAILDNEMPIVDIYSVTDEQEVFSLTVKNVVAFDEAHPYYLNQGFIDQLILHYENLEDYEQCQKLIALKKELA